MVMHAKVVDGPGGGPPSVLPSDRRVVHMPRREHVRADPDLVPAAGHPGVAAAAAESPESSGTSPLAPPVSHVSDLAAEPTVEPATDVEDAAGDAAVAAQGVVIERWAREPLLERVGSHLSRPVGPPLAIGSINIDHFHHFGAGRIDLPNDPDATGVDWLMLADGAPVAARAAILTKRTWPRLTGADLLPDLLTIAAERGARVGFFGGAPAVQERLREVIAADYSGLEVAFWAPPREEVDSEEGSRRLAREIAEARVDILAVALGKPRQELWIQEHGAATGAGVLLAFGASADFLAGKVKRAPAWVQNSGLEWAYRLTREPKRLAKRYLVQGPPALARLVGARRL